MEEFGRVAATRQKLFLWFSSFSIEINKEQKYKESLGWCEDSKQNLQDSSNNVATIDISIVSPAKSQVSLNSNMTPEMPTSCRREVKTFLTWSLYVSLGVFQQNDNDPDEDDDVKEENNQYRSQESTKEHSRMLEETAAYKNTIIKIIATQTALYIYQNLHIAIIHCI